jgi:hypothetical protein
MAITNEDHDTAWVAVFLSEAVSQMAEGEDRDITITSFRQGDLLKDNEGFTIRFGRSGPEYQVSVVRSA